MLTAAGGLLRVALGWWQGGFIQNIGQAFALIAELWEFSLGLRLAWNMRLRQVLLEIESKSVAELLLARVECHRHWSLVRPIKQLLDRNWKVEVQHIYREGNKCADRFANIALGNPLGVSRLIHPLLNCKSFLGNILRALCP